MMKNNTHTASAMAFPTILFWAFSLLLSAVMVLHPEMMLSAYAADLTATGNADLTQFGESGLPGDAGTSYAGTALGSATYAFYNTFNRIVAPVVALVAGIFGLFALIRGFNIIVIGSSFGVAVIAGLLPAILTQTVGVTPSVF